jgi:radical SAM superfamily enzyme YgiQ (UPF0313 family)
MKVVLISTYDLGHQPFGLASPAAWLGERGAQVACVDLAIQSLTEHETLESITQADAIAFYLPMHTATRIAADVIGRVRALNPSAHLCAYGLYAPMNAAFLKKLGVRTILGGEFEEELTAAIFGGDEAGKTDSDAQADIPKLRFRVPDRSSLPDLTRYAFLMLPDGTRRKVGYTEASRGCKHLCRHCPIVPVYDGQFRVIQHDVVMADIDQLIAAGAEHISFGDPDFLNGPRHAVEIAKALHHRHPGVTYDVTIKVEHLVRHSALLSVLRDTGCAFVTSAVESVDDRILQILKKGHTRADVVRVLESFRDLGLTLSPTFVAFTPWITLRGYQELLQFVADLDLVDSVAPVQLSIRLLIPEGSRLLELPELKTFITHFDEHALCFRWKHPDARVDELQRDAEAAIKKSLHGGARKSRRAAFHELWGVLKQYIDDPTLPAEPTFCRSAGGVPQLSENWYCCAEPTEEQITCV